MSGHRESQGIPQEILDAASGDLDDLASNLDEPDEPEDPDAPPATGMDEATRERLRALRAARDVPLAERPGLRSLHAAEVTAHLAAHLHPSQDTPAPSSAHDSNHDASTGARRRTGRGIAALIPEPGWSAPPRLDGRHLLEADWLVTATSRVLHHAPLGAADLSDLADHDGVERNNAPTPLRLTCGRTAWAVARPNRIERDANPRCEQCSDALGYPHGAGSPLSDPACEAPLRTRLEALT